MNTTNNPKDLNGLLSQLDKVSQEYFVTKAPLALPENLKEFIVKVAPYVSVVLAILLLPVVLAVFGLSALLAPVGMMGQAYFNPLSSLWGIVGWIFSVAGLVLWIMAIPGLFARSKKGWTFSWYNTLLNFVQSIFTGNLIGGLISLVVGLYVLYQVKDKYKN